jgi:hypothetical protein
MEDGAGQGEVEYVPARLNDDAPLSLRGVSFR